MKVKDYVETLTDEEREQFKDLIAECEERERLVTEHHEQAKVALRVLEGSMLELKASWETLVSSVGNLEDLTYATLLQLLPTTDIKH